MKVVAGCVVMYKVRVRTTVPMLSLESILNVPDKLARIVDSSDLVVDLQCRPYASKDHMYMKFFAVAALFDPGTAVFNYAVATPIEEELIDEIRATGVIRIGEAVKTLEILRDPINRTLIPLVLDPVIGLCTQLLEDSDLESAGSESLSQFMADVVFKS